MGKLTRSASRIVVLAVVLAIVAAGAYYVFFRSAGTNSITARFTSAVGVYKGTPVKILGVDVGEVTSVKPTGSYVAVTMEYDDSHKLPADAGAVEVANSLVSDRYIQLTPPYTDADAKNGKPIMQSGATIPNSRTGAPAELDDIYGALNKLSVALGPAGANKGGTKGGALSALIDVSAANLKGNGAALGNSITKLSQAARTLSDNKGDLFSTVKNLQRFTSTLKSSDTQIRLFNKQLAQVAGDLANERADLGTALHDLGLALDAVSKFVKNNASRFHTDIGGLRQITGVLVKQRAALNEMFAIAPVALANIVHAYQPDVGGLGTRSNLASLSNLSASTVLQSVCTTLTGPLNSTLPQLGGNVSDVCSKVAAATKGTGSAPTLPGLPVLIGAK